MIDIEKITKCRVEALWSKYRKKDFYDFRIPPRSPYRIPESGIIFIGINPSLGDKDRKRYQKSPSSSVQYVKLNSEHTKHQYFKKFKELSHQTGLDWGHLDLLYLQETSQSKIETITKNGNGLGFVWEHLKISKEILDYLLSSEGKYIFVVSNTLARRYLGKDKKGESNTWLNYQFEFSQDLGTDICNGHPFFFTSMLSGQRALDNGSFERLIWHINFVKEKIFKPTNH